MNAIKTPDQPHWQHVFNLWPSLAELAADIGKNPRAVQKWKERDSVPAEELYGIWMAGLRRGLPLTAERLLVVAAIRPQNQDSIEPVAHSSPAESATPAG